MGDNRNNSYDSRSWNGGEGGGVRREALMGRSTLRYWNTLATDRVLTFIDEPRLPIEDAAGRAELTRCIENRPPASETTPPHSR